MAKKINELYIGDEFLTLEGANVKHPALSEYYANININKITDKKMKFIGIDLETNHKTGELKLLGFVNEFDEYDYYTRNFLGILFSKIKDAYWDKTKLAWWNKLDHFVLFKQFLLHLNKNEEEIEENIKAIKLSLEKFGKISGEYDRKNGKWKKDNPPVIELEIGNYYFGISNVIRSSIQFYFINKNNPNRINKVWAYDIASLFKRGLEKEAKRLDYYSKVDKSAHLVDWNKFDNDKNYRENIVLKSNYLDARAVKDLARISIENFYKIFNYYPTSLISAGSLARAGIVATITNFNKGDKKKIIDDLNSIPLYNYKENWLKQLGQMKYKSLISIFNEAYSGGYIEAIAYGTAKTAYMADIASAYPSVAVDLYDLRGAKITAGKGTPPHIDKSYCFIRGDVFIPDNVDYHPITIKHPHLKDTNIRAVGNFRASYTIRERDYLLTLGATFKKEQWFNIKTTGKLSPIAKAVRHFLDARTKFLAIKDSAEYTAKTCANSIYGILYEAIKTYKLMLEEVKRGGYRVGEFNNPLYASVITSEVRILISKGTNAIKEKGGQPIVIMTDSIFWKGEANMLPEELWREKKTLGFFEKPEKVTDLVCLGAGRYEYYTKENKYQGKKRGLNIVDLVDKNENGIVLNNFNWSNFIKLAIKQNNEVVKTSVRVLISVGLVNMQERFNYEDLGLIMDDQRKVELIVGHTKRVIPEYKVKDLSEKLIVTKPLMLLYKDHTLNLLRKKMLKRKVITKKQKTKKVQQKSSLKYYENNKDSINNLRKENYHKLRNNGFNSKEATKLSKKSKINIQKILNKS